MQKESVTELPESWPVGYQHTSTISDITRISPPNRATRGCKGTLFLNDRAVYLNTTTQEWKYTDKTPVPRAEFWIPQSYNRPPNDTAEHKGRYYYNKVETYFDKQSKWWIYVDREANPYIEDKAFTGPHWIAGGEGHLPEELRKGEGTPKPTSALAGKGIFRAPSGSSPDSSGSSRSEYAGASDLPEETGVPTLNPLRIEFADIKLTETFSLKSDTHSKIPNLKPLLSPPRPRTPVDIVMANNTEDRNGIKPPIPQRLTGERKQTKSFMTNVEIYFTLSTQYNTDKKKIAFVLLLIGDKAEQWKRNKITDLNNTAKTDTQKNN